MSGAAVDQGSEDVLPVSPREGGKPERITLGRFPSMTVEQARKQAAKINLAIESGANPADAKRAHKAEQTFGELFQDYLERHAKPPVGCHRFPGRFR